jgi:hypothetical protein
MSEAETYTPTAEEHRERARLLRACAKVMSTKEGRYRFLEIAEELDQLADSMEQECVS